MVRYDSLFCKESLLMNPYSHNYMSYEFTISNRPDFDTIIKWLNEGKRIRKKHWPDNQYIYKKDGKLYNEQGKKYYLLNVDALWVIYNHTFLGLKPGTKFKFDQNSEICTKLNDGLYHDHKHNVHNLFDNPEIILCE